MPKNLKISVITPSFNSVKYIEEAIKSVLIQEYPEFEHIIVDGGSTDGTTDILSRYTHLKWISESDRRQSDAMNKGFRLSHGDIIVYLNSDDYFLPGAFHRVVPYFLDGAYFVMGTVRVEKDDGRFWINDAQITHDEMLKHWEDNAFCINPVGYFYRREVQENTRGFNEDNHLAMDLKFLLECSLKYNFTKILEKEPLGVFMFHEETKTFQSNENIESIFSTENYQFIDRFLENKSPHYIEIFNILREEGYRSRIEKHLNNINNDSKPTLNNKPHRWKSKLLLKISDFRNSDNKAEIIRQFVRRNFSRK